MTSPDSTAGPSSPPAGPRRVILHVGTPKTGTSYAQDVLLRNQALLLEHGVLYPAERFDAHFLAALDLMRLPWGGLEAEAVGAWDALAARVRDHDGTTIISHEILATASRSQVRRALASLRGPEASTDPEIHVVLSVRDLARQIPAEWQENVKHRAALSYARFLEQIRDPDRSGRLASWFWGVQELPDILDRWAHDLPPAQVHLVTVPPPGGPPSLLWERFSAVFGLDGIELDLETERANPSLGVPETALIRRINQAATREVAPADYRPLVRELLAHRTLSARRGSPRLGLPPDARAWVDGLERSWVEELAARGYDVVGDLDDLLGVRRVGGAQAPDDTLADTTDDTGRSTGPPEGWADPDAPRERQVAAAGVDAIKALLLEGARLRHREAELAEQLEETRRELERAYLRPSYRLREKVVRRLETSLPGRSVLRVYRFARGRSSRSA